MPLEDFQQSLQALSKDRKLLYHHLGRQLYHMGESLNGKYRHLQVAYTTFFVSMAMATITALLGDQTLH